MLIKIFKWHCKYIEVYPRMFNKFYRWLNKFLFNLMIIKYNPIKEIYKDIHPDPNLSKFTHVVKYTFDNFSVSFGKGGHPYAVISFSILDKNHIPFGDGIVA